MIQLKKNCIFRFKNKMNLTLNAYACNRRTLVWCELAKSTIKIKKIVWSKNFNEKK